MTAMLDIAGGIVIGGIALWMLQMGLSLVLLDDDPVRRGENGLVGGLMLLLSGVFCVWLLFWHTGIIPTAIGLS